MTSKSKDLIAKNSNKSLKIKNDLIEDLRQIIEKTRQSVAVAINSSLTVLYWKIGHRIRSEILQDKRADYGIDNARYQPRLHDLRHTFAVHRLMNWYQENDNVQQLLPTLSVYMGHTYLSATSVYLTMTKDLLQEAGRRFEKYARRNNNG
jgi:integrase